MTKKIYIFISLLLLIACGNKQISYDVQLDIDSISESQQKQWNEVVNIDSLTYPLSNAFFAHWEQLSDEYAASHPCPNINHVYRIVFMHFCDSNNSYSYYVLPPSVKVRKYSSEFDPKHYHSKLDEDFFKEAPEFAYIPQLHTNKPVLCLFDSVEKALGEYLGGVKDEYGKDINKEHVNDLQQHIEVHYGHWGGYWHLETMPIIFRMYFFSNGVYTCLRDSWWTGKEILELTFSNGTVKVFDAKDYIASHPLFAALKDQKLFSQFELDGWTVSWLNGKLDIAPEYLLQA